MSNDKNPPAGKFSVGSMSVAIWCQEGQGGRPYYNTTFELRYKDENGEWKTSDSYSQTDLLTLAKAADLAFTEIVLLRKQDNEAAKAA
jgi:hypothetical protein